MSAKQSIFKQLAMCEEILKARASLAALPADASTPAGQAKAQALVRRRVQAIRTQLIPGYTSGNDPAIDALFAPHAMEGAVLQAIGDVSQLDPAQRVSAGLIARDLALMAESLVIKEIRMGLRKERIPTVQIDELCKQLVPLDDRTTVEEFRFFETYRASKPVLSQALERGKFEAAQLDEAKQVGEKIAQAREQLHAQLKLLREEKNRRYSEANEIWRQSHRETDPQKARQLSQQYSDQIDAYYEWHKESFQIKEANLIEQIRGQRALNEQSAQQFHAKQMQAINAGNDITPEQASEWAGQCLITTAAKNRLKKIGYAPEQVLKDMAEFYRFTRARVDKIIIDSKGDKRANATDITSHGTAGRIYLDGSFNKVTLWHEMGHHIEADPAAKSAASLFIRLRADDTKSYTLRSLTGVKGYRTDEVAVKDGFFSPYVGKIYPGGITEVFSMGLETFADPVLLAERMSKDPQTLEFVLGYIKNPKSELDRLHQAMRQAMLAMNEGAAEDVENATQKAIERIAQGVHITLSDNAQWIEENNMGWELDALKLTSYGYLDAGAGVRIAIFSGKVTNQDTRRKCNGYMAYVCRRLDESRVKKNRMQIPTKDSDQLKAALGQWVKLIARDGQDVWPPSFGSLLRGSFKEKL